MYTEIRIDYFEAGEQFSECVKIKLKIKKTRYIYAFR